MVPGEHRFLRPRPRERADRNALSRRCGSARAVAHPVCSRQPRGYRPRAGARPGAGITQCRGALGCRLSTRSQLRRTRRVAAGDRVHQPVYRIRRSAAGLRTGAVVRRARHGSGGRREGRAQPVAGDPFLPAAVAGAPRQSVRAEIRQRAGARRLAPSRARRFRRDRHSAFWRNAPAASGGCRCNRAVDLCPALPDLSP